MAAPLFGLAISAVSSIAIGAAAKAATKGMDDMAAAGRAAMGVVPEAMTKAVDTRLRNAPPKNLLHQMSELQGMSVEIDGIIRNGDSIKTLKDESAGALEVFENITHITPSSVDDLLSGR